MDVFNLCKIPGFLGCCLKNHLANLVAKWKRKREKEKEKEGGKEAYSKNGRRAGTATAQPLVDKKNVLMLVHRNDLANLAPRKPDWDLKRDVAKKLEKLEKRTQRAIAELIREKKAGYK
ncbi:Coiled-coil domain-containing protein 12 [Varanus komodoensis]|nr:Coiled-coil domain-containing protein 12 [Varanus komodoensis]